MVEMQPGRRLVEDVEGAAGGAPRQFLRQFDALRLSARERRRRLADMNVAEPDALQGLQFVSDRRYGAEEIGALVDRHVEHVGDALAAEQHFEGLAVVAAALADVALDIDVRQKMHLDLDDAVALAGLAAPALDVEREAAGQIAARLGLGEPGEPVADRREAAGIGRRVRARRAADRRLVDVDDLVEKLDPLEPTQRRRLLAGVVEAFGERLVERLDDQGRFAAARDAGDAAKGAERDLGGDALQIVAAGVEDAEDLPRVADAADQWDRNLAHADEILAGDAVGARHDRFRGALGDDMPAMDPSTRSHIDDPIRGADRLFVVLDDDNRVAEVAQPLQGPQEAPVVALMQPDRGLVEDIEPSGRPGADLRGQPDALTLAAGERSGSPR